MTKMLLIFLIACFCLTAGARNDVKVERISTLGSQQVTTANFPTKYSKDALHPAFTRPTNLPVKTTKAPKNADYVTITCVRDCDNNFDEHDWRYNFVDQNGNFYAFQGFMLDYEPDYTIEIPCGTYDVAAIYFNESDYTQYYIIHEQVAISNDTTFSFNPAEATVHIQFEPRLPNGEKCYPETCFIYDNYTQETIVEGNIGNLCYNTNIITTKGQFICGLGANWANIWTGFIDRDATHGSDIFINQVSDRFVFSCNMSFPRYEFDNSFYVVDFELSACKDTILTNTAEDYVVYEKRFKQTPYGIENGNGFHPGMGVCVHLSQESLGGFRMLENDYTINDNEPTKYYLCNNHEDNSPVTYIISPQVGDAPNPWMPDFELLLTRDMFVTLQDGELIHVNRGLSSLEDDTYNIKPTPEAAGGVDLYHPLNEWNQQFSYPIEKMKITSGNSCPILVPVVYANYNQETGEITKTLYCTNNLGRNGEYRESDIFASHVKLVVNGEVSGEVDGQPFLSWPDVAEAEGVVDLTVINENVDVDGLPGKNVTNIHFDLAGDDNTAPTLQMLDFRDTEDNAIDRFETASEGKLQFYCGDFNPQYIDNEQHTQYFVCNDLAGVEVAYSPYQTEEWTPLDANEVAEFYYDGMGHYYAAPLASVTGQSFEGWFDLKIKLIDQSGNWQEQVISPAFRIDDHAYSSVANVGKDNAHEVARYTLDGRRISTPQPGINIVRYSDGTARKVLVAQ